MIPYLFEVVYVCSISYSLVPRASGDYLSALSDDVFRMSWGSDGLKKHTQVESNNSVVTRAFDVHM